MIEDIFLDCLNAVKKQVGKRGSEATYAAFRQKDKAKVIEMLLRNDHVQMFLYENLFPKTKQTGERGIGKKRLKLTVANPRKLRLKEPDFTLGSQLNLLGTPLSRNSVLKGSYSSNLISRQVETRPATSKDTMWTSEKKSHSFLH